MSRVFCLGVTQSGQSAGPGSRKPEVDLAGSNPATQTEHFRKPLVEGYLGSIP